MRKYKRLSDSYRFPGFKPLEEIDGIFGDSKAIIIRLKRVEKKQYAQYVQKDIRVFTTEKSDMYVICLVATNEYISQWKYVVLIVRNAKK